MIWLVRHCYKHKKSCQRLVPSHGAPTAVLLPPDTVGLLQMFLCVYKKEEHLLASLHRAIQLARPPHHILPSRSPLPKCFHLAAPFCPTLPVFFPNRINAFPHAEPKARNGPHLPSVSPHCPPSLLPGHTLGHIATFPNHSLRPEIGIEAAKQGNALPQLNT